MRRTDTGRVEGPHEGTPRRHRLRLGVTSAGLIAVPLAALAFAGSSGSLDTQDLSATEVRTAAPVTTSAVVVGREAVPARQLVAEPKGVAIVAPPTTTTTTPPPPTTEVAPAVEVVPAPEPVDRPDPDVYKRQRQRQRGVAGC